MYAKPKIIQFVTFVLGGAIAGSALGQTMPTKPSADVTYSTGRAASASEPFNPYPSYPSPALSYPHMTNPHPPVHIFTADQARSQIKAKGFSGISEMQKDSNGFWRGKAMKNGKPVDVILDFWGDVVAK